MDPDKLTPVPPVRILLVDDHPAVRQGLALFLAPEGIVCAEAGGRTEALAHLQKDRPDLAIVDLSLEGEDGLELISDLHDRHVPVLVYSMHHDARRVGSAFAAGALGYATKREFDSVLLQGIREVAAGRRFVSPKAAAALAGSLAEPPPDDAISTLSAHERKVFELLGHGEGTYEIARALEVSSRTVESYYERIKIKMSLSGMYELRRHAIEHLQQRPR